VACVSNSRKISLVRARVFFKYEFVVSICFVNRRDPFVTLPELVRNVHTHSRVVFMRAKYTRPRPAGGFPCPLPYDSFLTPPPSSSSSSSANFIVKSILRRVETRTMSSSGGNDGSSSSSSGGGGD